MAREPHKSEFGAECEYLARSREHAHKSFYQAETFGGPSLHFHHRALAAGRGTADDFAEPVYAVLVAWGMHRMGPGGSKMRDFDEFHGSIRRVWSQVQSLQKAEPASLDKSGWDALGKVFQGIRCMKSHSSLVGNSKVMAHALPNLIPPVDRKYTLNFLCGNPQIANDMPHEWARLRSFLEGFFYPLLTHSPLSNSSRRWMANGTKFVWDTSPLKVIDNLVIGVRGKMPRTPAKRFNVRSAI